MKKLKCKKCNRKITTGSKSGLCQSCSMKNYYKDITKHPSYIDGRTLKKYHCPICGKEITIGSKLGFCQSCSAKERYKDPKEHKKMSKALIGRVSPMKGRKQTEKTREKMSKSHYIHGQSHLPYSLEFTQSLRNEIRTRDKFVCQGCGMTQEEHFKKYNRNLEIHHIDYNKFNCNKDNLITLCKQCNINANYDRDYYYAFYTYLTKERT